MNRKRTVSGDTLNDVPMSERSDEDSSIRQETRHVNKRKRQLGNNPMMNSNNNPEVKEHIRSTIKMKQQKELSKQLNQTPLSSSPPSSRTTSPPEPKVGRKRNVNSPKYRNSKNLTISTNMEAGRNSPRPISAPINPAPNKLAPFHRMSAVDHGTTVLQGKNNFYKYIYNFLNLK